MHAQPVIAVFDIGKTNKKWFLFDRHYRIVREETVQLTLTEDEEGFPCEDVNVLSAWVEETYRRLLNLDGFSVQAVNFSAYGASLVHVGNDGRPLTPLYNYLKPYPAALHRQFYHTYGGEATLARELASPVLGYLNSGLQLYWLKHHRPDVYAQVRWSLHLPQYLSYLVTGQAYTDITSLGCHTHLWDFRKGDYHDWVYREELHRKFAPVVPGHTVVEGTGKGESIPAGVGLHDSSAALIPYLASFPEPFLLISTGTWCISLNPFNQRPLTAGELEKECLCYLSFQGKAVKAARLFAGQEHEEQTKRISAWFGTTEDRYKGVACQPELIRRLEEKWPGGELSGADFSGGTTPSAFPGRDLSSFASYEEAYHQLLRDIIAQQAASTSLVVQDSGVKRIFVDGGFGKNPVYMHLLAAAFPGQEVFAASMAQASALGAALAIHEHWNPGPLPAGLVDLRYYAHPYSVTV
ncbi:MAG TPA: FGGY family carbohydrate kinase [Chitinophagaceae bacterium]|jgi:sugar (pentulose or hexulose) kinase|nr:FGGY family carbohydrate kinase [Chitinophagaceae bacterium]